MRESCIYCIFVGGEVQITDGGSVVGVWTANCFNLGKLSGLVVGTGLDRFCLVARSLVGGLESPSPLTPHPSPVSNPNATLLLHKVKYLIKSPMA